MGPKSELRYEGVTKAGDMDLRFVYLYIVLFFNDRMGALDSDRSLRYSFGGAGQDALTHSLYQLQISSIQTSIIQTYTTCSCIFLGGCIYEIPKAP